MTKSSDHDTTNNLIHEAWMRQRAELEQELFEIDQPRSSSVRIDAAQLQSNETREAKSVTQRPKSHPLAAPALTNAALTNAATTSNAPVIAPSRNQTQTSLSIERTISHTIPIGPLSNRMNDESETKVEHANWLHRANEAAAVERQKQQQHLEQELSRQRIAFQQDLARQRAGFEQELAERESAWAAKRDQEWSGLRNSKEVQDVTVQQLKDKLATQRVHEREELHDWRRRAESELTEARRLFEQERLQQQSLFAREREAELQKLRHEREEFDARVRQTQFELANSRHRQEEELRQIRATHTAQMQSERAELEQLRESWLDKFRREQVVLENGLRFFEQHLSRVSQELHTAHRGLQAVSLSAGEASMTIPFPSSSVTRSETATHAVESIPQIQSISQIHSESTRSMTLEDIRSKLERLRQHDKSVA